jgi:sulfur transfer complex TusBCD TusB component (DsrH family)
MWLDNPDLHQYLKTEDDVVLIMNAVWLRPTVE